LDVFEKIRFGCTQTQAGSFFFFDGIGDD